MQCGLADFAQLHLKASYKRSSQNRKMNGIEGDIISIFNGILNVTIKCVRSPLSWISFWRLLVLFSPYFLVWVWPHWSYAVYATRRPFCFSYRYSSFFLKGLKFLVSCCIPTRVIDLIVKLNCLQNIRRVYA